MSFKKFCAKCGKETNALIKAQCADCYLGKKELFVIEKPIFSVCKHCGKFISNQKWFPLSESAISEEILKKIKYDHELTLPKPFVEVNQVSDSEILSYEVLVKVEGFIDGVLVSQEKELVFKIKPTTCDACMKLNANYREAVVQIRAEKAEAKKIYETAILILDKEKVTNSLAGTSKIIEIPQGYDLWIGDKKVAAKLVRTLSKMYDMKVVTSKKIIGEEGGRGHFVFRFTFCLKKK
ncbi:MAG TPA: 60S ribosomal export protein NMD3 [archaeon]|nr:60S ribosomal export protein NMD3 [archaeon]